MTLICWAWICLITLHIVNAVPGPNPAEPVLPNSSQNSRVSPDLPKPWLRTVSGKVQRVTPTVVDGITFSAKPRPGKTPPPWVSLEKDGIAKTIVPKVKGIETKNNWPDYGTYFDSSYTTIHDLQALLGDAGEKDQYHTEVVLIPEDKSNQVLNPLIRCTPDRYFTTNDEPLGSAPFCTPQENSHILLGVTHWVTWYTKFFNQQDKVRLHLSIIQSKHTKRSIEQQANHRLNDELIVHRRDISDSIFTSDWLENNGMYPLEIKESWLDGEYEQLAVLSIQGESDLDNSFDLLQGSIVKLRRGPTVIKEDKDEKFKKIKTQDDDSFLFGILIIPTILLVFLVFYLFVSWSTRKKRSFTSLKPRSRRSALSERYTYEMNKYN